VTEHQIVVVFDVDTTDRLAAGRQVLKNLVQSKTRMHTLGVESWWFPEQDLKVLDGNDNAAMTLEHDDWVDGDQQLPHPGSCADADCNGVHP
jgi:hypothetical protein